MASYLIYDNVIKPKQELKEVKQEKQELEENITQTAINRPIEVNNAVIANEANKTIILIEEMQDAERTIKHDDVNYSDILSGMFIFNPQRED